ncbi:MAG: hypothetical protein R2697_14360 [Ilumatobacteraceae bacterium]
MDARRRLAILGPMGELDDPVAGHARVAADARERGIEVTATGTDLYGIAPTDDPVAALGELGEGDVVLVESQPSRRPRTLRHPTPGIVRWGQAPSGVQRLMASTSTARRCLTPSGPTPRRRGWR